MSSSAPASAAERHRSFVRAFLASVFGTGLSRVLGAARDVAIAGFLGAGAVTDAWVIAWTIPGIFRRFVADEGLTGALIPTLSRAEADDGEAGARRLANETLTVLLLANLVFCVLGVAFAEYLVLAFAWDFREDPAQLALATRLTRWLFPFVAMVSLVSYAEGLLNYKGHFFVPKLAPGLVSAGIVGSLLLFATRFEHPVWAVVMGVLVGGVAHVLVNLPWVWKRWGPVGLSVRFADPKLHTLLRELGKVIVIGVFAQINVIVLRQLATAQGDGAVTWYWNATRIVDLAQGMIAVAIGSALLPNVSAAVAEASWDRFRDDLVNAFRLAGFMLLPVAAVLATFSVPVTAILFRHGKYTWADAQATALTVQLLVPFMLAVAAINIVKKVYFALEDRQTLLGVAAVGVALTAALGYVLAGPWGVPGLALALSLATTLQLVAYVVVLRWRLGARLGLGQLWPALLKMVACCVPVLAILAGAAWLGDWSEGPTSLVNLALLVGGLGLAAVAYLLAARALGLSEYQAFVRRFASRLGRR